MSSRRVARSLIYSVVALAGLLGPARALAQQLSVVTVTPGGTPAGALATVSGLAMTPDEQYVAFCSAANSLDPTKTDTNGLADVYRRHLPSGVTTLVSVRTDGTAAGNGGCPSSTYVRMSADGRYVAFLSEATDLVTGMVDSTSNDIFVRDMQTGTTSLVSVNAAGTQAAGTTANFFDLSDNGRHVTFESYATSLVTGFVDGNGAGFSDIFQRDLQTATTKLVSASHVSVTQGGNASSNLGGANNLYMTSADGRMVAFMSNASDLIDGYSPITIELYVRDMQTNTTERGDATNPSDWFGITADGRWLAFARGSNSVWVRDLQNNSTSHVSVNASNTGEANGPSNIATISRYPKTPGQQDYVVAFQSLASDLVSGVTRICPPGAPTVYARTLPAGPTVLVGGVPDGTTTGNNYDFVRNISPDGRYIVFDSTSTNLVSGVTDTAVPDLFRRDLTTNTTTILTVTQPGGTTGAQGLQGGSVGQNGGVLFHTNSNLIPSDTNFNTDLYFSGVIPLPPPATYTISGQVRDLNDTGVAGVTMTLSGTSSATQTTDLDGRYAFTSLAQGGTFTVTPSRATFTFTPPSQTFPNLQRDEVAAFFVANVGTFTRYFAEGATGGFFDTQIALLNATGTTSDVTVRFLKEDGTSTTQPLTMAGLAHATVDPETLAGTEAAAFSTIIESTQPIIADRRMEWDGTHYGSHGETSIARPETTWYLAEGATTGSFNLFYLLQNPNQSAAVVEIRYLRPTPLPPIVKTYNVGATSRLTINVNAEDPGLDEAEISAVVRSTNSVPIIVERSMYTNAGGQLFGAGHESAGIPNLATQWFLAEGATGPFFHLFILIANPNDQDAQIEARYLLPSGDVITRTYVASANSRFTIGVHADPELANTPVSTTVTSTNQVPVLVERAMWWPATTPEWYEGHNSAGVTASGEKWGLADGENGGAFNAQTFILVANTSASTANVEVKLIFEDGTTAVKTYGIAGNSRFNVHVPSEFPAAENRKFGAVVESLGATPAQIVVERSVYSDANGLSFAAGANAPGTKLR